MSGKILAGRYELLSKKGDGGMAVVYKARDTYLNRYVAIKILKPEYIKDSKFVDNFRRESQAAAKLSHPNIVSVYDVGKEGNIYFIVMELLDGDSLSDVIEKHAPLNEKKVVEISKQIAMGLSAAHRKNIIHRDIKPHNILMTEEGVPKIADFGIAKAVNQGTMVQSSSVVMGSVHYLSPEQAKGISVDARSDIYSLGIVMYEMLTGTVPFDGENAVSVAVMHVNNDVPAPSEKNIYISAHMDEIVRKATRRTPAERFLNAEELIRALDGAPVERTRLSSADTRMFGAAAAAGAGAAAASAARRPYPSGKANVPPPKKGALNAKRQAEAAGQGPGNDAYQPPAPKKKKEKDGKKKHKGIKALAIILALICAIVISVSAVTFMHSGQRKSSDKIYVPNVIGMTQEEAVRKIEESNLQYNISDQLITGTQYEAGTVADTDPQKGTAVKKGVVVTLMFSAGVEPEKIEVPDLAEMDVAAAKSKLKEYELAVGQLSYEYSSDVAKDYIIRTDPAAHSAVDKGTAVALIISQGPEKKNVKAPNLLGMTESQARKALEDLGLTLGKVTQSESEKPEGTVISQGVSEGMSIETGQSVSVVISSGKKHEDEPEPEPERESTVNYTVDLSKAESESVEVRVDLTRSDNSVITVYSGRNNKADGSVVVPIKEKGKGRVNVYLDGAKTQSDSIDFNKGEIS